MTWFPVFESPAGGPCRCQECLEREGAPRMVETLDDDEEPIEHRAVNDTWTAEIGGPVGADSRHI
jgi:hypothetical protein